MLKKVNNKDENVHRFAIITYTFQSLFFAKTNGHSIKLSLAYRINDILFLAQPIKK